jgi:ribosomal protein L23
LLNASIKLVRADKPLRPNQALFHVPLHFTKPLLKEYLTRLYGVTVGRIDTVIQAGKVRRITTSKRISNHREPDIKKAYVSFQGEFFRE